MISLQQLSCEDPSRIPLLQSLQAREPILTPEPQLNWAAPRCILVVTLFASVGPTHDGKTSLIIFIHCATIFRVCVPNQVIPM